MNDFADFGLVRRAEQAEKERDRLMLALQHGWSWGMYQWALEHPDDVAADWWPKSGASADAKVAS